MTSYRAVSRASTATKPWFLLCSSSSIMFRIRILRFLNSFKQLLQLSRLSKRTHKSTKIESFIFKQQSLELWNHVSFDVQTFHKNIKFLTISSTQIGKRLKHNALIQEVSSCHGRHRILTSNLSFLDSVAIKSLLRAQHTDDQEVHRVTYWQTIYRTHCELQRRVQLRRLRTLIFECFVEFSVILREFVDSFTMKFLWVIKLKIWIFICLKQKQKIVILNCC